MLRILLLQIFGSWLLFRFFHGVHEIQRVWRKAFLRELRLARHMARKSALEGAVPAMAVRL